MVVDALERLAFAMVAITNVALASVGDGIELTFPQWRVIVVLGARDRPVRVRDLAAAVGASPSSTSRLLDRLELRGLVELAPDPSDGRGRLVTLSARGREIRARVIEHRRRLIAGDVHGALPGDLEAGLEAIADALAHWV